MTEPLNTLTLDPVSLEYSNLIAYSFRTVLRMMIAMVISLIFTLIYATLAAKNSRLEQILIPLLDILQSVPILGYISFTITAFLALFPSSIMGAECAAIFAIFTSQVWNMIFSCYQSFKTVPEELNDVASVFKMSGWRKFWQIEVPFAIPSLAWNMVISMSSSWFFVVASEVIMVGNNKITLPGIGSYIYLAIEQQNTAAILYAVLAMSLIIILYDQLLLRPLIVWSERFRYETSTGAKSGYSWVLTIFQQSIIIKKLFSPLAFIVKFLLYSSLFNSIAVINPKIVENNHNKVWLNYLWYLTLIFSGAITLFYIGSFLQNVGWHEIVKVFILASITLLRIVILIILASLFWVPIGIYIGLRPRLTAIVQPFTQFFAAFPVNLLFPIVFIVITKYDLNPNIWLSPLMIVGTQWYILFNVIVGVSALPSDLKDVAKILNVKGLEWWKKVILPAIAPYFIVGAITACGGAWNASIVAEVINFGNQKIVAKGLGSYIAEMTVAADFNKIILGIGVMSLFVVLINRLFWQPINEYSNKRFQLL
ncbi:ABC transporter permease [Rickettsia endosymbiont of Halotydeus destructor]|uniref:ABC transporter permease n=1 Tax=Rickettsia endosymbiont of Halotydeus destructor TaxID=2996754 RepID=UPI003BAF3298